MFIITLVRTLQEINNNYGKGDIDSVTINMKDSKPTKNEWYGTAKRRFHNGGSDERMFKVEDRVLTFLSHKRKVNI